MAAFGKILGLITALVLIFQVVSSFARQKLGTHFQKIHRYGGILLVLLFGVHATILYSIVGPPKSLWHLSGTIAATLALLALITGFYRKSLGSKFLSSHKILACAALLFAVAHRVLPFVGL